MDRRGFLKVAGGVTIGAVLGSEVLVRIGDIKYKSLNVRPKITYDDPDVFVYLCDTLRADHLGPYGYRTYHYDKSPSPNLDNFSEGGVIFENHYSHASWTKPSMGSIFTGVTPRVHRSVVAYSPYDDPPRNYIHALNREFTTVAEIFKERGYQTSRFLFNQNVASELGYGRGFGYDVYNTRPLIDNIGAWLDSADSNRPVFVFIHELDPHSPYWPNVREFELINGMSKTEAFASLSFNDKSIISKLEYFFQFGGIIPKLNELSRDGSRYIQMLYDSEIFRIDLQLKNLLDLIKTYNRDKNNIVVFTSDHGEGFGEHPGIKNNFGDRFGWESYFHGTSLYNELIHVPLIIGGSAVPSSQRGKRVPWSTGHVDLCSTLMGFSGGTVPDYIQGRHIIDLAGGISIKNHREIFSYHDGNRDDVNSWGVSLIFGDVKIIGSSYGNVKEIYDLSLDSLEQDNLFPRKANFFNHFIGVFKSGIRENIELALYFGDQPTWANVGYSNEALRALGYLR